MNHLIPFIAAYAEIIAAIAAAIAISMAAIVLFLFLRAQSLALTASDAAVVAADAAVVAIDSWRKSRSASFFASQAGAHLSKSESLFSGNSNFRLTSGSPHSSNSFSNETGMLSPNVGAVRHAASAAKRQSAAACP